MLSSFQRIKSAALLLTLLGSLTTMALPATATAAPLSYFGGASSTAACAGLSQLDSSQACGNGQSTLNKVVKAVVQILSWVVGIVAVVMVIIAGFKYITSGGDPQAVGSAKRSLTYAIVGLVVVALAQALVHFVIAKAR